MKTANKCKSYEKFCSALIDLIEDFKESLTPIDVIYSLINEAASIAAYKCERPKKTTNIMIECMIKEMLDDAIKYQLKNFKDN